MISDLSLVPGTARLIDPPEVSALEGPHLAADDGHSVEVGLALARYGDGGAGGQTLPNLTKFYPT